MVQMKNVTLSISVILLCGLLFFTTPIFVRAYGDTSAKEWMEIDWLHTHGYKGDDVTIAIIESGCVDHSYFTETLNTNLVKYIQVDSNTSLHEATSWDNAYVSDSYGHGTGVVGVALQFAPEADLVFYEAYAANDTHETAARFGAALEHLADNAITYGVDILSLSWGMQPNELDLLAECTNHSYVIETIETALQDLVDAGVTIFIASGNSNQVGLHNVAWPACLAGSVEGIISVGAVYDSDAANTYDDPPSTRRYAGERWVDVVDDGSGSSYDSENLTLMAVGVDVRTTVNDGVSWRDDATGTSFSAPMAAGITACLIEQYLSVPSGQRPATITPAFINRTLCENAEIIYEGDTAEEQGFGVIRPVESMINWHDFVDTKTAIYGTVTDFNNLIDGSGSTTFQESSYPEDDIEVGDADFSTWPVPDWTVENGANWHKESTGGQSGAYAKCQIGEGPPETGSGYLLSEEYDTRNVDEVKLEFYVKTGFYPGELEVSVIDSFSNWDIIGTYSYKYAWTKITWSSTSWEYQHQYFQVKFEATVEDNEWVGIDSFLLETNTQTHKFGHDFFFTDRQESLYGNATLLINITGHTGTEYLKISCYDGAWHELSTTVDTGDYSFDVGVYAISSNFKLRIESVTNTGDYTQDSWTIRYLRLLVLDVSIGLYTG